MSEQPEGVDQRLERGLSDEQVLAGSDAAADADPAQDRDEFADAVQQEARVRDEPQ